MSAVPRGSSGQFAGTAAAGQRTGLATLPDELLLAVLRRLAANGDEDDQEPWYVKQRPYIQDDPADSVHLGLRPKLGLRAYPFLATVCTQWRALLRTPQAIEQLCDSLVIDFGHEVITSIHTPLARSSNPPTSQEWVDAFMELKLSAQKICDYYFSAQRAAGATSLAIHNGDGFGEDDPHTGYFPLRGSHDFGPATLGMALGLLAPHLETLYINNSNSVLSTDSGAWTSISLLPRLRELVVADIDHRVGYRAAAGIGRLTALTRLLLGAKQTIQPLQSAEHRTPGISLIPDSWSCLTALERFELRGHKELASLPSWMPTTLTRLTHLDVSDGFQHDDGFDLTLVPSFRGLRCLVLQGMGLTESAGLTLPVLPDLSPLAGSLTALSLARNELYKVPNCFTTLSNLQWLDLSRNRLMPLSSYRSLNVAFWPQLRVLNLQARPHEQTESEVISVAAELSQQLSRRPYPTKVVVGVAAPTTDDAPLTAAVAGQGLGVQQL